MTGRVIATGTAGWIPVPHLMEVVRADTHPPPEITTAAFGLVCDARGHVLLTHVNLPGRSWDVPGGHIDAGENARQAAAREIIEETGLLVPADALTLLGWQRFTLHQRPPASYPYPFPVSYTLMFTTRTNSNRPPLNPPPDSECGPAGWFTRTQARQQCATCTWLPFLAELTED
ncbi:NUDIX hydrolase [Actinoplanes flavus]|uniref:NUDIX hydrolase n=1 Tax=Actinoplanes flavus TaxID=2820290 RepID=A0ABS3UCY1_9ACTN|nr:NUDIX hydrolase [Actinoplanes flavus]MBO3736632.1 NUDIX hydrolase [Actinoplanes flavus]